jgi:hypothetical protein
MYVANSPLTKGAGGIFIQYINVSKEKSPEPPLKKGELPPSIKKHLFLWGYLRIIILFLVFVNASQPVALLLFRNREWS